MSVFLGGLLLAGCGCCNECEHCQKKEAGVKTEPAGIKSVAGEPAVVMLENGLKYQVLTPAPADAQVAADGDKVTVHYTGWLNKNGKQGAKFDSSVDRGEPFVFSLGVGQVIKGWDLGVKGMKVGEKRRLTIPASLGYGSRRVGQIPAGSILIFDVELLQIN